MRREARGLGGARDVQRVGFGTGAGALASGASEAQAAYDSCVGDSGPACVPSTCGFGEVGESVV